MKFVISGAFQPPQHLVPIALAAEEAGYEAMAFSDHAIYPETLDTPYPYTDDGSRRYDENSEFPDAWVVAGALAAVTKRLRFTTNVFVLPMRNPFLAAKAIATAAAISSDRITLTVGVGWSKVEFELLGQDFQRRGARADEMLEVMQKLWSGEMVEHDGEFYRFDRLKLTPPIPEKRIPVWVGGISQPALRRAARNDGWLSDLQTTAEILECVETVRAHRERLGRSESFDVMASASDAGNVEGYQRLGDGGVNHILTMPWAFYHGLTDDLEKKIDGIQRFGDDVIEKMR
ncbi:MAG: TIGR03619 family F420-dependent LLM class oxidoreductase [Deltaproteobacteria bacterium]|nr:TIGR03619 family F420-dependent LLM class oxidoreductase [Deltaproteobacteria bacterium]MBW2361730.1 TIGR03619 family F420-dependent LLM class oxidoreductase [Deltaproteobacteria bacterium]